MHKLISERTAALGIMAILGTMILFHLAVLTGLIPFNLVWGGRLSTHEEMVRFETVSIALNSIMVVLAAIRAGMLRVKLPAGVLRFTFLLMTLLFLLNTVGNLLSTNIWETIVFTPLTLLLSLLSLRLGVPPNHKKPELR